ncbi:hypothetical protein ACFLUP_01010 [Chloroflexota bacterium]
MTGNPVEQRQLPFVEFENGRPVGQEALSIVMFDKERQPIEMEIPPPFIFDGQGNQLAIQEMPTFLLNDHNQPLGIESGATFTPEGNLFMPGGPPPGEFMPGEPPPIVYQSDGTPMTLEQFRPSVVMRDEVGDKIGYQPTQEIWFADPEVVLGMGEKYREIMTGKEDIPVVVFDETGAPNIVQLSREVFFDKDGNMVGEQPPPFLAVEEFGKPTGLYKADSNFWQPNPLFDGQPPPPPPDGYYPEGQPPGGWPAGPQVIYDRDGNPMGQYQVAPEKGPNFELFGETPAFIPTYRIEGDQWVVMPTEGRTFEFVAPPPGGAPLRGIPGEWIPPEGWKEPPPPPPDGYYPEGMPPPPPPDGEYPVLPPPPDGEYPVLPPPPDGEYPVLPPPPDGYYPEEPPPPPPDEDPPEEPPPPPPG